MEMKHLWYTVLAFFWMFAVTTARPHHPKTDDEEEPFSPKRKIEDVYQKILASESAQSRVNQGLEEMIDNIETSLDQVDAEREDLMLTYAETEDIFRIEENEINNRSNILETREIFFVDDMDKIYLDFSRIDDKLSSSDADDLDVYESDFMKLVDPKDWVALGEHADETTLTELDVFQFSVNRVSAQINWVYKHLTERNLILG